jgi:hypothetical protein
MVGQNVEDLVTSCSKYNTGIFLKTMNILELASCPSLNGSEGSSFFDDVVIFVFWKDSWREL